MVMASEASFNCRQLKATDLQPWLPLLSPLLRNYLAQLCHQYDPQQSNFVAFGLDHRDSASGTTQPIGLLLAEHVNDDQQSDAPSADVVILSVTIERSHRRRGFGMMLLKKLEEWSRKNNMARLRCPVPVPSSYAAALLKMTGSDFGWMSSPGKVVATLSTNPAVEQFLVRLEKVVAYRSRRAGWEIAAYPEQQTLSLQRRVRLASQRELAAPWDPNDDEMRWTPAVKHSRLLLSDGEIIGWLITHFVAKDCLRYAKFWVDPGWEKSGAPLALLADVMRSAHFNGGQGVIRKGCLIFHPANEQLDHWIGKQIKPVCDQWVEIQNRDLNLSRP